MARTRNRSYDPERTEQLALDELFVEKAASADSDWIVWNHASSPDHCPYCGSTSLKTHNHFKKYYLDLLPGTSEPRKFEYNFYKYRCLNPECRKIFAVPIKFATVNDHVTHRLENQIVQWVIEGNPYDQIVIMLQDTLTKPAVGQIFNRWLKEKAIRRKVLSPPSKLAVVSGMLNGNKDMYAVFLNLDDGIRVFDILYNAGSADIYGTLKEIGLDNIKMILSDCNPVITNVIQGYCPKIPYVVPINYWFQVVSEDFHRFSHEILKWCQVRNKDDLIMQRPDTLAYRDNLDNIFHSRPAIIEPHTKYNQLRTLISRRDEMWIFKELEDWVDSLDADMKRELHPSILLLHQLQRPIEEQLHYRDEIPDMLFHYTSTLEQILAEKQFRVFSDEILKARVLYSTENNLDHWTSVPIQNVISALRSLIKHNTEEE